MTEHLQLCTIDDIRALTQSASRYDAFYEMAQITATQMINNYIRRSLSYQVHTEFAGTVTSNNNSPSNVWLKGTPIDLTQPFTVTYSGTGNFDGVDPLSHNNWHVDVNSGKLELFIGTRRGGRTVMVTYTSGYGEIIDEDTNEGTGVLDVPKWIRLAAISQAVYIYEALVEGTLGQNEKLQGAEKIATHMLTIGTLQPAIKATMATLRKIMVGN